MKAVMLAAGVGARLEKGRDFKPKVLLEFGGQTLLRRHVAILRYLGFDELVMGVGHQAELIHDAIAGMRVRVSQLHHVVAVVTEGFTILRLDHNGAISPVRLLEA